MDGHPATVRDRPRRLVAVLPVAVFGAAVLLLLLMLTPVAGAGVAAGAHRDMDTWYDYIDVIGSWGYTGSSDGMVIRWPREGGMPSFVTPTEQAIHGLDMATASVGYLVTYAGAGGKACVYKTADAGATWTVKKTAKVDLIACVKFRSARLGWVAGRSGVIYKTANGGRTWVKQRSGTSQTIYWLSFPTDKIGYAVGSKGLILKTANAGKTWVKQKSRTTASLYSADFMSASVGYACGGDVAGVFRKTTDGGRHWKAMGTSLPPLVAVDFATKTTGYVLGDTGTWPALIAAIYKVEAGGKQWTLESQYDPSPPTYGLSSLKVMSMTEAYAEGQSEACLYTDGTVWHLVHIATP